MKTRKILRAMTASKNSADMHKPHIFMKYGRWRVELSRGCKLRDCRQARFWVDTRNAIFKPRMELVA